MKPAICAGCRLWQEINLQDLVKFGIDLEHIINFAGLRIIQFICIATQSSFKLDKITNNMISKSGELLFTLCAK
jgi:hypothetical protein